MKTFEKTRRDFKGGQEEALLRKLWLAAGGEQSGEEGLRAILRDEMGIQLIDVILKLVDSNGRYITLKGMKSVDDFVESNRNHYLTQPEIVTDTILSRLQHYFNGLTFVSAEEFQRRVSELMELLKTIKLMKNLTKGVHFPICLPKLQVNEYGKTLECIFLDAVKRSYEDQFPGRKFYNHRAGTLAGQVGIVSESRHGQLIEKMKIGPVVGIYFPNPMQGFSIPADRRMIEASPKGFLLTGAIDTAVAMVAMPDVLARDFNTSVLDCAANTWWQSSGSSLYFRAVDDELDERDLHLLRLAPRAWFQAGQETALERMPTAFGPVTLRVGLARDTRELRVAFQPRFRQPPRRVVLHVPPLDPAPTTLRLNGKAFRIAGRRTIEI